MREVQGWCASSIGNCIEPFSPVICVSFLRKIGRAEDEYLAIVSNKKTLAAVLTNVIINRSQDTDIIQCESVGKTKSDSFEKKLTIQETLQCRC